MSSVEYYLFLNIRSSSEGAVMTTGSLTPSTQPDIHDSKFDFREEALLPAVNVLELLVRQAPSRAGRR